jgi:hypothetical protein
MMSSRVIWIQFDRAPEFPIRFCEIKIVGEKRLRERSVRLAQSAVQLERFLRGRLCLR